ncbi:MAG TPA: hypothetical protein DCG71_03165 [Brevundimonas sp.]|nr:hypothetical protein [Brevundimonas sp.]
MRGAHLMQGFAGLVLIGLGLMTAGSSFQIGDASPLGRAWAALAAGLFLVLDQIMFRRDAP